MPERMVKAAEDITESTTVVVQHGVARRHRGAGIPRDAEVATALEDIRAGESGRVDVWIQREDEEAT